MSFVHAAPLAPLIAGFCSWRFHFEDVDLSCTDRAIPGTDHCADHYIEHIQQRDLRERRNHDDTAATRRQDLDSRARYSPAPYPERRPPEPLRP